MKIDESNLFSFLISVFISYTYHRLPFQILRLGEKNKNGW